ncbi:unnamed protein product [Dovyalis caffra]|uniref:FBD domain-containing protein n=1 Tax=Dovyalis caffra TaxID=77055 RepID=A0AAV1QXI7_9ROSI|nr:unnamed protein product [Dovyalis caffra]
MSLPIREAAKTSILSMKWRDKWRGLPNLVFDHFSFQVSPGNAALSRAKVLFNIYQVLLLHRGPIPKFTLSIPELGSCPEIDQLVFFLRDKHIQEFTFHSWGMGRHKLPSSFFSYEQLRHLNLAFCLLKAPPTFGGFSRLISVEFQAVDFASNVFESFISKCPLLEQLTIDDCPNIGCLEIDAPNLKSLTFHGVFESICFKNAPRLDFVVIDSILQLHGENAMYNKGHASNMIKVLEGLPAIEYLCIGYLFLKYMAVGKSPQRFPANINHLRVIEVPNMCFGKMEDVSCILCLIMSSPNLQKLELAATCFEDAAATDVLELFEDQELSDDSLKQLQEVWINSFIGEAAELEFVKFLLAKSVVLEKILIQPPPGIVAEEGLNILRRLTRFRRASSKAEIIYVNPDEDRATIVSPVDVCYQLGPKTDAIKSELQSVA